GQQLKALTVADKFLPDAGLTKGVRNNLAFESLTVSPDGRSLYTANEAAMLQDGAVSGLGTRSPVRIVRYDRASRLPLQEFLYHVDPIPAVPNPPSGAKDNGLVDLIAVDNNGTLLALERSFAAGVGNTIRIYEVRTQVATDVSQIPALG